MRSAGAAAVPPPPIPRGVFALSPTGRDVADAILTHRRVAGITLRASWNTVERTEGAYNWRYFDRNLARVAEVNKPVLLRLVSGGINTPDWVDALGVTTISFTRTVPYLPGEGETATVPLFWDPVFLEQKKRLIAAAGRRFAAHPQVALVSASCANALTDDWYVPSAAQDMDWSPYAYTPEKLIAACKEIIDATMAAFPRQLVLMSVSWQVSGLDPDPDFVARRVVAYARAAYPGRFVLHKNTISAFVPDPTKTRHLASWQILYDYRPEVAGQMLWPVTNDPTCRMNKKVTPCDPKRVLRRAVTLGHEYGTQYQEIYAEDILNPDLAGVIRYAADLLQSP